MTAISASPIARATTLSRAQLRSAAVAVLRAGTGLLFMEHGLQKLFGLLGGFMGTPGATAPLVSQMGLAGVLELVGGTLLVLGLLTRPAALVLLGEMLFAFFTVHAPQGGAPVQNGGELALLYAIVFAFFAVNGGGAVSLDAAASARRAERS
jgi:Predicted membrane protein